MIVAVAWPIVVYVVVGAAAISRSRMLAALSPITTAALMPDMLMTRLDQIPRAS